MSIFRVKLTQGQGLSAQGALDTSVVNGVSKQRTMYVEGPNRTFRNLRDGEVFTDVNYWKRYTNAVLDPSDAFIEVVSDDGSVWNDRGIANSFVVSYSTVVRQGDTYGSQLTGVNRNVFDLLAMNGVPATFLQVTSVSPGNTSFINVRLNGTAVFPLLANTTQTFSNNEVSVSKIEFSDLDTTSIVPATVTILASFSPRAKS